MGEPISMAWPVRGVFETSAGVAQPEGTTPSALNVRTRDPRTGRTTGGQRAALTKYVGSEVSAGNPGQCLIGTIKQASNITYALAGTPTVEWQTTLQSGLDAIAFAVDRQSNLYVAVGDGGLGTSINYIAKYNAGGTLLYTYPVPLADTGHIIKSIRVDELGGIYVAIAGSGVVTAQLIKFVPVDGEETLREAWRVEAPNSGLWVDIAIRNGYFYAIENTAGTSRVHRYDGAFTAEPALVWTYDLGATGYTCCACAVDGSVYCSLPGTSGAALGIVRKVGPHGALVWSITTAQAVGHALVADSTGLIYTQGVHDWTLAAGNRRHVSKIRDNGTTTTNVWEVQTSETTYQGASSLAIDAQGNVYQAVTAAGGANVTLYRIQAGGAALDWSYTYADGTNQDGLSVVIDPVTLLDGTTEKSEFVYLGVQSAGTAQYGAIKLRMMTVSSSNAAVRTLEVLAVAGGTIKRKNGAAWSAVSGSTLDSASRYIVAAAAYNRVLFADAESYVSYDVLTQTASAWAATKGEIPRRGKLLTIWNGRAVVARFADDPQNWAMSAQDDLDDFDFFPPVTTTVQAIIGNNSAAGRCPDIVNALIPYSDDLLIFGGDTTIYRLTGDPMAGGRFDLVSDVTGIAFGATWAKDEQGTVYFFGSRGGIWRMSPSQLPESISGAIDDRLREIDLTTHRVILEWNDREDTLHVFVSPFSAGATTHFAWEREFGAWQFDAFTSTGMNPLATCVIDGDQPGDRVLLLFGSGTNSYVRYWNPDATSDDGDAIPSYAFLGPVQAGGLSREFKLHDLRAVIGAGSSTVDYATYGSEQAEFASIGSAVVSGTWTAGRNDAVWGKTRGQAVWLKVGRFAPSSAGVWSFESVHAMVTPAGRSRNR